MSRAVTMEPDARRRGALRALAALACASALPRVAAAPAALLERTIPATGERIPAVGMGTWLTFDVAPGAERGARLAVLREFFSGGGTLLDSSPMYGYAEAALGELVPKATPARVFSATKVWTPTRFLGVRQMEIRRKGMSPWPSRTIGRLWKRILGTPRYKKPSPGSKREIEGVISLAMEPALGRRQDVAAATAAATVRR